MYTKARILSYSCFGVGALESLSSNHRQGPVRLDSRVGSMFIKPSPLGSPQPFLPLAPSPLAPFTNTTIPKLSGSFLDDFGFFGFSNA